MSARSLNRAELIGNLTADPVMRTTNNGTMVATFSVATNRSFTDSSGTAQQVADFHNVVAFGKLAEICQNLLKIGSKVYVSGRLQTRKWEDQNGVTRYRTEIVAEEMILLGNGRPMDDSNVSYDEESQKVSPSDVPTDVVTADDFVGGTDSSGKDAKQPENKKDESKGKKSSKENVEESEEKVDVDDVPF